MNSQLRSLGLSGTQGFCAPESSSGAPTISAFFQIPPTRVACATDMEKGSVAAEKLAFEVACKFNAQLTFVCVDMTFVYHAELLASSGGLTSPAFDPAKQKEFLKEKECALRNHLEQICGTYPFDLFMESGDPAMAILSWLQDGKDGNACKADLLIAGRKQKSALENFFLGSTASNLLEEAKVPVLLVPESASVPFAPQSIFVATDLASDDTNVTLLSTQFARTFGANCTLLHAFEHQDYRPIPPEYFTSVEVYHELSALLLNAREVKTNHLKREAERIAAKFECKVDSQLIEGPIKESILHFVNQANPGLLVLGRFSDRGFLGKMLLGSTARGLAMHVNCPVLLVPHTLD